MPKPAKGELTWTADGPVARIILNAQEAAVPNVTHAVLAIGVCLLGCAKPAEKAEPTITSAPTAIAEATLPPSVPSNTPATATVSVANFRGKELVMCTDWEATPEKIAKLRADLTADNPGTILAQPCNSLGQPALSTCKRKFYAEHYYKGSHSDAYMADCVKSGGVWSRNDSEDAEMSRTKQELEKLQGKAP